MLNGKEKEIPAFSMDFYTHGIFWFLGCQPPILEITCTRAGCMASGQLLRVPVYSIHAPRLTAMQPYVHPRFPATGSHLYTFPCDLFLVCSVETIFSWIFFPLSSPPSPEKLTHICTTLNTTRMINLFLEPLSRNLSTYLDFESRVREGFVNVRKEEEKDLFILGSKCVTIYIETRYFISNWFESLLYSLFLSYSCIRNFIRYLKSVNLFQQFLKFLYKNISIYIYGIIFNASKILKIFNEFLFFSDEKQEIIIIFHFSLV